MATEELPHYKLKQSLLYNPDAKPDELRRWGHKFLEQGWIRDAILFFHKADDQEGLSQIRRQVIEQGDVFLFRQVLQGQEENAEEAEWRQLGDRALALGKLQFAREAYRMVGDRKAIDKIDKMINPQAEEERQEQPAGDETEGME